MFRKGRQRPQASTQHRLVPLAGRDLHRLQPLRQGRETAGVAGLVPEAPARDLEAAWTLQQDLSQVLKLALPEAEDPSQEPEALRALLAKAGHAGSFAALTERLKTMKVAARKGYEAVLG